MSKDLAEARASELSTAEEEALAAAALGGVEKKDLLLPAVNVVQSLSKAHVEDDVPTGHFVNTLTEEDYGDSVELIVVHTFQGRFYSEKGSGQAWSAYGDVAPSHWPEQYAGQRFADLPDAEESYRERVNAEEIEWGSGPPISTTHNFVGFVPSEPGVPVRLSLMRTGNPAARKISTLLTFARTPWEQTIALDSERKQSGDRPYYVVNAAKGRQTTAEERQAAVALAQQVQAANAFALQGDEAQTSGRAKAKAEAEAGDGLDID